MTLVEPVAAPNPTQVAAYMADLEKRVGEAGELSGLDRRLLEMASARFNGEMMSGQLGGALSPERCLQRVREILKSVDWLSLVEQKQLVLLDLVELRDILFKIIRDQGGFKSVPDGNGGYLEVWAEGDPRWTQNLIRALDSMRKIIDSAKLELDGAEIKIRRSHAMAMTDSIELGLRRYTSMIEAKYGITIPTEESMEMMADAMSVAWKALEARTASA
jgi:hypothetical protein